MIFAEPVPFSEALEYTQGRRYTEVQATDVEIAWLEAKGVTVTAAGSFTETYNQPDAP